MLGIAVISIITATYEASAGIAQLADSLRAQTLREFEWVVIDGGSTDGTREILSQYNDVVTHWVSEPDFGIYHALNKGLALASGEYYLVIGADDQLEPNAIDAFTAALRDSPDVVSAPVRIDGELVRPRGPRDWVRSGPPMVSAHSVGTVIRRDLHQRLGMYSRRFPIAADTYFLLKAVAAGCRFVHIDEPVGRFGRHGVSSTDVLGALCESFRAHVEVQGRLPLQLLLFGLRLVRNYRRITRAVAAVRKSRGG
jgi:glycosyltransferase involved in cell wall biosynthesis